MKALKLDASFRPIEVIEAVEALVLCIVGKARAVESYTEEIRSPSTTFYLPAVIVLKRYVKYKFSNLTLKPNRVNVLWRDKMQCQYCTKYFKSEELTLDHVIPKSRGGTNKWENLVTACKKCNQKKGSKLPRESGMEPIFQPERPQNNRLGRLKESQISDMWKEYLWDFR
tara:strand:- start:8560 stop:9069 length:510 start_codon:yes stop_codon:yes gene_type:complete